MAENPGFGVKTLRQTCGRCGGGPLVSLYWDKTQEEWVCHHCIVAQYRMVDSP